MKRLAAVLLLVATLAASSAAFAQAQRWEYAALQILYRDSSARFGLLREATGIGLYGVDLRIVDTNGTRFVSKLREVYGGLSRDVYVHGGFLLQTLNLLGLHGWEVVTVETIPRDDPLEGYSTVEYLLRRPLH